jgi:hypothetical protein
MRSGPGPDLQPPPEVAVPGAQRSLVRDWRSVLLAPVGDGRRRRRGTDGMRLVAAVLALVCCLLIIHYDSRIDRAIVAVIHPPPWSITWLVTVVYQAPKGRESATERYRRARYNARRGKGEMVGGRKPLNVRAHQQPGDRLARQTPPGARPNKRAGLIRPVSDSRVGCWTARATARLEK